MGMGPVCWTSLLTGLSEWELGPRHTERSPIEDGSKVGRSSAHLLMHPTRTLSQSSIKQSEQTTES